MQQVDVSSTSSYDIIPLTLSPLPYINRMLLQTTRSIINQNEFIINESSTILKPAVSIRFA